MVQSNSPFKSTLLDTIEHKMLHTDVNIKRITTVFKTVLFLSVSTDGNVQNNH